MPDAPRAFAEALRDKLASHSRDVRRRAIRRARTACACGTKDVRDVVRDAACVRAMLSRMIDDGGEDEEDEDDDEDIGEVFAEWCADARGGAMTAAMLEANGARECADVLNARLASTSSSRAVRRARGARAMVAMMDEVRERARWEGASGDDGVGYAKGGYDGEAELAARANARRADDDDDDDDERFTARCRDGGVYQHQYGRTSTSSAPSSSHMKVSFKASSASRGVASASGDDGYRLPFVTTSESDRQYLYSLVAHLDACAHHTLAHAGLRELRRALIDVPVESVAQLASRALERACELLSAMDPELSSPETRREALAVIQTCAMALQRELIDVNRQSLLASSPNENLPPSARGHGYGASKGEPTKVLPMAHTFMTHVIPAMREPSLRADAIRAARLLLPLVQIAAENDGASPHSGALTRLGQYLDLFEATLEHLEFESGAASEYLTCVQVSAEFAAIAGGASARGSGAANVRLIKRWHDVCVDEVFAAANPLARQFCANALAHICPTLARELAIVRDADQCLHAVSNAISGASTPTSTSYAQLILDATPALSLIESESNAGQASAHMVATLLALTSEDDEEADMENVITAVLALLTHSTTTVRVSAYATLAAASAIDSTACAVLEHPSIIGEVIIGGLNHASTMFDAATCLESACSVTQNHRRVAGQIAIYSAWLDALDGDDAVGMAVAEARRLIENVRRETGGGKWEKLLPALRGLFHDDEEVRTTSATDVAHDISHGLSASAEVLIASCSDPFDAVLLTDDQYVRNTRSNASTSTHDNSRSKTFKDVRDLLQDFMSAEPRSREMIAHELESLVRDSRLAPALADAASLDALLKTVLETGAHSIVVTGTLRVLAAAAGASSLVREMLTRDDSRGCRIMRTLRLVFHPQARIRESMASLLTQVLFVPVMEAVVARVGAPKPSTLSLPKLFLETYRFPRFVPELASPPALGDSNPMHDGLVDTDRVMRMFKQRQLLTHTYNIRTDAEALSSFAMNEDEEYDSADVRVMRDAARVSCPPFVIGGLITELGSAQSHAAAARVVAALKTLTQTSRPHAMSALASLGHWPETSARFLRRPPRTTTDTWLWVDLAEMLTMCLESFLRVKDDNLPYASMLALVQIVREVIQPLTSAGARLNGDPDDDASRDPPALRHPLAAARALGADGGAQCAARASAVRAGMELFTQVCEALGRFALRATPQDDVADLMANFMSVDCVGAITDALLPVKNCDYMARVAGLDAATIALKLVPLPQIVVADMVAALLTHVCPTYSASDHRGSTLVNKAITALLQVMQTGSREGWTDAWYERDNLDWLRDMLVDASSRTRAKAYDTLAAAVGPNSPIVDIVASEFPNIFELASGCALDRNEAATTRASACRCIASLVAGSAAAELLVDVRDDGYYAGATSKVPFPSIPMLAACDVWRGLARILNDDIAGDTERVAVLHRGASAALLAAARVDAQGIAEAFDFNPNHNDDGNMWYGAFDVLKRSKASFSGRALVDAANSASNIASLLGVMLVAGVKSFDAKLAAAALQESLVASVHVMRSTEANETISRTASRCAESLATVLQATVRGDADVVSTSGLAGHCAEILAMVVSEVRAECAHAATGACLLTTTLFRSSASAGRAKDGAFDHVGASLLESLSSLWELRSTGNAQQINRAPSMAIVIAAMRNVLAYDMSAKAAACEWGLIESFIATTRAAVQMASTGNGAFKTAPTATDVYMVSTAMKAKRKDVLAAALEFGTTADGTELPSSMVLSSLTCMRHLMYTPIDNSEDVMQFDEIVNDIRESAIDADIMSLFRITWPYAKFDQAVMYELLSLVTNFVAEHVNAKRVLTVTTPSDDGDKPTSFALQVMDYAFDVKHVPGSSTLELCLKALSSLASVEGPARYWLIRSVFVDETAMTLSHALMKLRAIGSDTNDAKDVSTKSRWMKTIAASTRALGNVASFTEGQRVVLRTNGAGTHILELCLETVAAAGGDDDVATRREAFLLMHNLAFHADAKAHFAANASVLDCLTYAVADTDIRCAASACATLFALVHHGQRVVAALREHGRDRALRAASKSRTHHHGASESAYFTHWSRALRGLLVILASSENAERWDGL